MNEKLGDAPVAQLAEHPPCKRKVRGSIPRRSSKNSTSVEQIARCCDPRIFWSPVSLLRSYTDKSSVILIFTDTANVSFSVGFCQTVRELFGGILK